MKAESLRIFQQKIKGTGQGGGNEGLSGMRMPLPAAACIDGEIPSAIAAKDI